VTSKKQECSEQGRRKTNPKKTDTFLVKKEGKKKKVLHPHHKGSEKRKYSGGSELLGL